MFAFDGSGGGGAPPSATDTLSNTDVLSLVLSWLVTASPPSVWNGNDTWMLPIAVHVKPSGDTDAVNNCSARSSISHCGCAQVLPAMNSVGHPVAVRATNSAQPSGLTLSMTCLASPAVPSRNMMPAFANAFV